MRVVGLSGGIACGKSTATTLLRNRGVEVIDCDQLAHEVVKKASIPTNELQPCCEDGRASAVPA
eukprot:356704-Chlamydomonas_euryale.AAC.21